MLLQYMGVYKYYINPLIRTSGSSAEDHSGVCGLSFRKFYELILNKPLPLDDPLVKAKGSSWAKLNNQLAGFERIFRSHSHVLTSSTSEKIQ